MEISTTQEKMLCERGVIVLPDCIEHETYETVLALLMLAETEWTDEPIRLFCAGSGGNANAGMVIADLVASNPQVVGMLAGIAESSHVTVFAACQRRFVYPLAQIGIHRISYHGIDTRQDAQSMLNRVMNLDVLEAQVATLLSKACEGKEHNYNWWLDRIHRSGSGSCEYFDADWMFSSGFAKPVRDYTDMLHWWEKIPDPVNKLYENIYDDAKARLDDAKPSKQSNLKSDTLEAQRQKLGEDLKAILGDADPDFVWVPAPLSVIYEDEFAKDDTQPIVFDEDIERDRAYPITYPCPFCGASLHLYDELFVAPDGDWYCSESHYDAVQVSQLNDNG